MRSEPGEDYSPTKFSIAEVQGDRSSCKCQLIVCVVASIVSCTAH